jgi:two-component system sensor histidine kinase KdpD
MRRNTLHRVSRWMLAGLTVILASGLMLSLRAWVTTPTVALLYLLPVGLSAAFWGLGPGLMAALGAFAAFNFFFLPPYFTLHVFRAEDLASLLIFLVVAVTINSLIGQTKSSLARAQAREHEAVHLHELAVALAGLAEYTAIVRAIAEHVQSTFLADAVRVILQSEPGTPSTVLVLPAASPAPETAPTSRIVIRGLHGAIGEISLWRLAGSLVAAEERLLGTISREAALAIDRAELAEAEDRARALAQSDALKSAILSSVSHELRSPLATIKASVSSLRTDVVDWDSEARRQLLAAVDEETDHLNELVGDLLDMSRIEAGSLRPRRQWNDLGEILQSVLGHMRPALGAHRLAIDLPPDLPLVPVDWVEIEQVLRNLLSNSAKFSPPDSTIGILARAQSPWMRVEVRNEGPAIPEKYLDRVFDKFFRFTAKEQVTGTGLGLSICKGMVEAHGGRIWVENVIGGVVFKFLLPLTLEGAGPRDPESHERPSTHPRD